MKQLIPKLSIRQKLKSRVKMNQAMIKNSIIIILIMFARYNSIACSCIGKHLSTVSTGLNESDVVILGKVVSKSSLEFDDSSFVPIMKHYKVAYTIVVCNVYKGKVDNDTLMIMTGNGHGDCGIYLDNTHKYLIYAKFMDRYFPRGKLVNKYLYTHICMRTMRNNWKERRMLRKHCIGLKG